MPLLAALVLAAATCGAWHDPASGFYPGIVESNGPKHIDTWIDQAPDGRLEGRYVLHEPNREVPGTLAPLGDESCNVAIFQWTDLYGSGLVRLEFDPDHHCFDGAWGGLAIEPNLVWHACIRNRVTS